MMDFKYDIFKHPSVRLTTDGKVELYIHGEPRNAGPSIELVYDPELVEAATEKVQVIELPDSNYVLLSEEDVEKDVKQEVVSFG